MYTKKEFIALFDRIKDEDEIMIDCEPYAKSSCATIENEAERHAMYNGHCKVFEYLPEDNIPRMLVAIRGVKREQIERE